MAATATVKVDKVTDMGAKAVSFVTVAVTSYDSTGISFTPAMVGLGYIDTVLVEVRGAAAANGPVVVNYDSTNKLLLAYKSSNGACDNATAFTLKVMVIGS